MRGLEVSGPRVGSGGGLEGPANSVFEGPLRDGRLFWFPRVDILDLALDRLLRAIREGWQGSAFCLVPEQPWDR